MCLQMRQIAFGVKPLANASDSEWMLVFVPKSQPAASLFKQLWTVKYDACETFSRQGSFKKPRKSRHRRVALQTVKYVSLMLYLVHAAGQKSVQKASQGAVSTAAMYCKYRVEVALDTCRRMGYGRIKCHENAQKCSKYQPRGALGMSTFCSNWY